MTIKERIKKFLFRQKTTKTDRKPPTDRERERQARNEEIVRRVKAGETRKDVAGAFGLNPNTVSKICRKAGGPTAKTGRRSTDNERQSRNAEIVRRVQAGESPAAVGEAFGLAQATVERICQQAELRQRNRMKGKGQRQARNAAIVRRVQAGESPSALAEEYGLNIDTVRDICRKAGVNLLAVWKKKSQARNAEIARRVKEGESQTAVAMELGLSRERVRQICKVAGFSKQEETRKRNAEIARRVKAGEAPDTVAEAFGLKPSTVGGICRKAGVSVQASRKETQERNAEIVRRVKGGESTKDVGKDFGLTNDQVSYICRKAGLRHRNRMSDKDQREKRNAEIVRRVQAGEATKDVAKDFGIARVTVNYICRDARKNAQTDHSACAGSEAEEAPMTIEERNRRLMTRIRDKKDTWKPLTDRQIEERDAEIVRRIEAGDDPGAVKKEFGIGQEYAKEICRAAGVTVGWRRLPAEQRTKQKHRQRMNDKDQRQKRDAEIVRRVKAGETPKTVGKDFGLTNNQVSYICRKAGLRQRNRMNDKGQREKRNAEIIRRIKAGESQAAVAKDFGLTPQHTSVICREAGFSKQKEIQARNAEIVRRCRAGERQAAVAKDFGLTPSTVKWICWKARRGAA